MKRMLLAAAVSALLSTSAHGATIIGLYNTGVKSGGTEFGTAGGVNTLGAADPHWIMLSKTGTAPLGAFNGTPIHGSWASNNSTSLWLTPEANGNVSYDPSVAGNYVFRLSFDLTGFDPNSASFTGRFLSDNRVLGISLNGPPSIGSGDGFNTSSWDSFSADSGFVSGVNTLDFMLRNDAASSGNPLGLRVEFLSSSVAVPEPATWAMMIAGFGLVGGVMRRRRTVRVSFAPTI